MVDHDDALAQRLDVRHVVAREQHRGAVALVVVGDERADALLHRHVEADRRLVEEEHLRPMQERADDLGLHPLTERELPHRLADEVADVEQLDQLVPQRHELVARDAVDRAVELVRVECRKIPLQLVAVAHDERDPAEERALPLRRDMAEHVGVPTARMEQPGEHLQRRRLPGAVRAEEADDLALVDGERDGVDRAHLARLPLEEALRGRDEARVALGHVEDLLAGGRRRRRASAHQPLRFSFPCRFAYSLTPREDPEAERDRDGADDEQRPDLVSRAPTAGHPRGSRSRAFERVRRGRDRRDPLHPLRQDLDRVVDARHHEQRALGDEPELRPLLR